MESFFTNLFATNEVILIALYGQAFFVLGLSAALQWRRESRLELARSVPLLAAFGLVEASSIWGDVFIQQQEGFLAPAEIQLLRLAQLLLMLTGSAFLLHFGLRLNWNSPWTPRLPWLLWGMGAVLLALAHLNELPPMLLRLRFEQFSRPLLVFTGSMLAAWGMRSTAAQIEAMGLPSHIVNWLRVAGLSFGAYAIFGGLLMPLTPEQVRITKLAFAGIPFALPRLLAIGILAWAMIQVLTIFRIELQRAKEEMGQFRALASERQRIGRELHDGTIQAIYGAGLLLENARSFMREDPDAADRMFQEAMTLLNKTIGDVRRYIFELSDGEGQLAEALGMLVSEMRHQSGREIVYRLEGHLPRCPVEFHNHLLQMAREGITNALRHSGGSEIVVALNGEPDALLLTITDNGRGLPPGGAFRPGGQGVPNMRARAALLGGTLRLHNRPGSGFTVEVVVPYREQFPPREIDDKGLEWYETSTNPVG